MFKYDIIETGVAGYRLVWAERRYLLRLAAFPCLLKTLSFALIVLLGWEQNFIRQALVMLPSYFADGWLLCHLSRLVFTGQRWPMRPSGDSDRDMRAMRESALGQMRGTLMFVVIKFIGAGLTAFFYIVGRNEALLTDENLGAGVFFAAVAVFMFLFWAFRLLWLYIPAAVNYPLRRFLRDLGGYSASWYLIGTWMIGFLPVFFVFGQIVAAVASGETGGVTQLGAGGVAAIVILHMLMDTMAALLTTAAIATGIRNHVVPQNPSGR